MITVKQLRTELEHLPDDYVIILSSDAEGNHFSPLAEDALGWYRPETTWFGDVHCEHEGEHDEDECIFIPDKDEDFRCVVLWPVN